MAANPTDDQFQTIRELSHVHTVPLYPDDGVADVYYPVAHPDQDESIPVRDGEPWHVRVVRLLLEDGEWRVHRIGPPGP